MTIERSTDHATRIPKNLLAQFKNDPIMLAIVAAIADEVQAVEDALAQIRTSRRLEDANDASLQKIGAKVGEPANTLIANDGYRNRVRVRVLINKSNGKTAEISTILKKFEQSDDGSFQISDYPPASFLVEQEIPPANPIADIVRIISTTKGDGVGARFVYVDGYAPFAEWGTSIFYPERSEVGASSVSALDIGGSLSSEVDPDYLECGSALDDPDASSAVLSTAVDYSIGGTLAGMVIA